MNDTKILQLLEKLAEGQEDTNKRLDNLTKDVHNLQGLSKDVQDLTKDMQGLKGLSKDMQGISKEVLGLTKDTQGISKNVQGLTKEMQGLKHALEQTNQILAHQKTAIEILPTKKDLDIAIDTAKTELQAIILDQGAKITRVIHNHETRIKNLESHTGTTDPTKN